jgi:hypothetical protein
MKKDAPKSLPDTKNPNVKEISDGVYINLNRFSTAHKAFGRAIEKSFKELDSGKNDWKSNKIGTSIINSESRKLK